MRDDTESVLLDEEFIRKLLINKKNLNITGHDKNEGGYSSPLCYSIFNNDKVLFKQLLEAGADINYQLDNYKWNALTYALRYSNDFFIKELIATNQLDPYVKINKLNNIEHVLSHQSLPKIETKDFLNRLKMYISYLNDKKDLDLNKFFSDNSTIFDISYPAELKIKFIIKEFPESWLTHQMDLDIKALNAQYFEKRSRLPIFIFELLGELKPPVVKKIIKVTNLNQIDRNGNTLLHDCAYAINNPSNSSLVEKNKKIKEELLSILLGYNCNPYIENKKGETVNDLMANNYTYKKYLINESYNNLKQKIDIKETKKVKRLKI